MFKPLLFRCYEEMQKMFKFGPEQTDETSWEKIARLSKKNVNTWGNLNFEKFSNYGYQSPKSAYNVGHWIHYLNLLISVNISEKHSFVPIKGVEDFLFRGSKLFLAINKKTSIILVWNRCFNCVVPLSSLKKRWS